jgi:hypothetical protein
MPDLRPSEALRAQGADEAAALIRAFCKPQLPLEEAEDFGRFFDRFADAKVVFLGEATHGTSQFYRARAAITRRLIEKRVHMVAVEADWPDAADRPPRPPPRAEPWAPSAKIDEFERAATDMVRDVASQITASIIKSIQDAMRNLGTPRG